MLTRDFVTSYEHGDSKSTLVLTGDNRPVGFFHSISGDTPASLPDCDLCCVRVVSTLLLIGSAVLLALCCFSSSMETATMAAVTAYHSMNGSW